MICCLGLTRDEVQGVMGDRLAEFDRWMAGQTQGICCEHGVVTYPVDVEQFLRGGRPLD